MPTHPRLSPIDWCNMQARYWIFFVIVAVGLALSWGQLGRKTQRAFEEKPVVFLVAERPCRPRSTPCAAVAEDRALVLGPAAHGLAVKPAGAGLEDTARVEAIAIDAGGEVLAEYLPVRDHAGWSVPDPPAQAALLRVRVSGGGATTVADFPL